MEYDIHGSLKAASSIDPTSGAAAGASVVGSVIDTAQDEQFLALEHVIQAGTITTGDFSVVLEESDTGAFGGEETPVDPADIIGVLPTWSGGGDSDKVGRVGVVGKKQFQRLELVGASTPVADFSALAILGHPKSEPVADQS